MALTKQLKSLVKHSAEIISYFETLYSSTYSVSPYVDLTEPDSETVTITFNHDTEEGMDWRFLQPVSDYCKLKNISWKICTIGNKFAIELGY